MQKAQGFVENGNLVVTVGGVSAAQKSQGSYPQATVAVYNAGTLVLATIYSDNSSTPKANPFTAATNGYFFFYAANGRYDVTFSAGGLSAPLTFGDVLLADPFSAGGAVTSFNGRTGAVVPATNDYSTSQISGFPSTSTGLQYLRSKAQTPTAYEFASLPLINAADYIFAAQTPGGSLSIGSNTITLTPVPPGVNGTNTNFLLYISGGAGAAEAVLVTGGTAVSGASSGTVIVTCANTHSGAWTIQSASLGISEAMATLTAAGGRIDTTLLTGAQTLFGLVTIPPNVGVLLGAITLTGPSSGPTFKLGGDYSKLYGIFPETTIIQAAPATGEIILQANSSSSVFAQHQEVSHLTIKLTNVNGSADAIKGDAIWYSKWEDLYLYASGGTVNGAGIHLKDFSSGAVAQGSYINTIERCFIGNNVGTGFAKGIWLDAQDAAFAETVFNLIGNYVTYNTTNLWVGGTQSARWVNIIGGGYNYAISNSINLVKSDQCWLIGVDVEQNGSGGTGYGITGTTVTELFILGSFAGNTDGDIDPGVSFQKLWDFSDHAGVNRGEINYWGAQPAVVHKNNSFTLSNRAGINYDGSTYEIGFNARSLSATTCNLFDIALTGSVWRLNALGITFFTCTAGANPRTLTQQWSNVGAEVGQSRNYVVDGGANNAITATLTGMTVASGLRVTVKLQHTLQAGANTFNGVSIKSSRNPANNIAVAYAATGTIDLLYDSTGPYYLDMSQ